MTITHRLSKHELYPVWLGMKQRCNDPAHISYRNYGGKGIKVCKEWSESFVAFLQDMGERPGKGYSIERIDSSKDYEPGNCKWATRLEQNENKVNNKYITFDGQTKTVKAWSKEIGIHYRTLMKRYDYGWDVEKMLTTPAVVGRNQTWSKAA